MPSLSIGGPLLEGLHASIIQPFWQKYGAVAHYDFTDSSKLVPGATSTDVEGWKDSTLNNYNLSQPTASAQPTFTQPNGPITFTADALDGLPNNPNDFTYGVKLSTSDISVNNVFFGNSVTAGSRVLISAGGTTISIRPSDNSTTNWTVSIAQDTVYAIFITRTGNDYELYINGVSQGVRTNAANFTPNRLGLRESAASPFNGDMYGCQYYPTALNTTQIANLTAELNS